MTRSKLNLGALWTSFSIAAVWFSTHCGGGFATGNQEVNFFVKFGWYSALLPILAMVIVAWTYRNALILAKDAHAHDYRSFANALYHPYEKLLAPLFEICLLATILIAVSSSIAGAGALMRKTLGVPFFLGITGIGVLVLCLTIFGAELIIRVLRYKAYFLIVALFILAFLGLKAGATNFRHAWAVRETFGTHSPEAIWKALLYVGFQAFGLVPAISVSHGITTRRECNLFGAFGVILNGGFLAVMCIMLLGFAPAALKETLPVHFVTLRLGIPWLQIIYSLLLFVALMGTAISFVFTSVARFEKAWTPREGRSVNLRLRRAIIALVTVLICTGASTFGLTALVVKGYGTVGYAGLLLVVLPLLTIGALKNRRLATGLRLQE